jgi:hypothetical protein
MATKEAEKLSDLEFVRCKVPQCIPRELVEAVKGKSFTPEQFYHYQAVNVDNPGNFLFALIDESKRIHGYLWAEKNSLDGSLFVNTFSVGKEHWGRGGSAIKDKLLGFLDEFSQKVHAKRTYWITTNSKFFEKLGFKRSKNVLMEYNSAI